MQYRHLTYNFLEVGEYLRHVPVDKRNLGYAIQEFYPSLQLTQPYNHELQPICQGRYYKLTQYCERQLASRQIILGRAWRGVPLGGQIRRGYRKRLVNGNMSHQLFQRGQSLLDYENYPTPLARIVRTAQ